LTALVAFPLGVGTAIWLEEYAPNNRLTGIIEANIANLAGVPSIVYGILGLAVFVRALAMGRSVIAGALTLALLILPVVIIASQEAIRAVPNSMRLGSYALGATRWETIRHHVLPHAMPGILTGTILALSRAVGEAAPLLLVGAVGFVQFAPRGLQDAFTAIPIPIFNWTSRPQAEFHELAAAGSIVLLVLLLAMNAVAILLRNRYAKRRGCRRRQEPRRARRTSRPRAPVVARSGGMDRLSCPRATSSSRRATSPCCTARRARSNTSRSASRIAGSSRSSDPPAAARARCFAASTG